jgi:hypothetical protein
MSERVQVEEISVVMDRIMDRLDLDVPNRLYNLVALRTGLHPTTVLRYHHGNIVSADVSVLQCVLEIEEQIRDGTPLLDDREESILSHGVATYADRLTWSTRKIQREMRRIMLLLDSDDPTPVYRYVSEILDISPITVMCHCSGALLEHSDAVAGVLRDLWHRLESGEAVVFHTGEAVEDRIVPRQCILQLVREIGAMEIVPATSHFTSTLESMTGIERGALRKTLAPDAPPFAPLEMHLRLASLIDRVSYEPCRHYEIGDTIHHHRFGIGKVVDKQHKCRILVQFKSGATRMLCEEVELQPYQFGT